jgi:2-polyprenyl-6-methoxyphenol hydroxylase-like FAD-dependent oxidoreductase
VVVGAGVGGLAVAGGLARTGWQVTLLERADRVLPGRAALLLWPSGVAALHALGLGAGLDAVASPVPPAGLRRAGGRWLRRPARSADPASAPIVVHGGDLYDAFIAGLGDHVDIRTGVTVRTGRPGGGRPGGGRPGGGRPDDGRLDDGRSDVGRPMVGDGRGSWEADLVVGADGLRSALRQRLFPAVRVVPGGCAAWRAIVPWYRTPRLPPDSPPAGDVLGVRHRFTYASLGERRSCGGNRPGGIAWAAVVPGAARPEPPEVQLGLLRRWFAGWPAPVGELLAATEPADLVQQTVAEVAPLPAAFHAPVGPGGYALLGDAAHAMVDHVGVGACLALEDAASLQALLVDAVPGASLAEALRTYTRLRRPRVARLARRSRRLSRLLRLGARAGDVALPVFAPRLMDSVSAAVAAWRPPTR